MCSVKWLFLNLRDKLNNTHLYVAVKIHKVENSDGITVANVKFFNYRWSNGTFTFNQVKVMSDYSRLLYKKQYSTIDTQIFPNILSL